MGQVLSMADIEAMFPEEWVLLADPETTANLQVTGGRLLWHSKSKEEIYRKAEEFPEATYTAVLYTGKIPEGSIFVL